MSERFVKTLLDSIIIYNNDLLIIDCLYRWCLDECLLFLCGCLSACLFALVLGGCSFWSCLVLVSAGGCLLVVLLCMLVVGRSLCVYVCVCCLLGLLVTLSQFFFYLIGIKVKGSWL